MAKAESRVGAVFSYDNLVAMNEATINLDGAPPDTDITVTMITPSGGVKEVVITSDASGHLDFTMVPNTSGDATLAATVVSVQALASDQTWVSGSAIPT
jgi:hypothetical protein